MRSNKTLFVFFALLLLLCLSAEYQNAFAKSNVQPLVDNEWLSENLNKKDIRLIHVASFGGKKEHFDMMHIPGSVYLSVNDVMGSLGNGSAQPDKGVFEVLMSKLGVSNDSHVIVLGGKGSNPLISSAFWLMKYHGHEKVSMLDGGAGKWINEGRKATGEPAVIKKSKYSAKPDPSIFARAEDVLQNSNKANAAIVDVRSPGEYTGKDNSMKNKRTGHIPGAINLEFTSTNLKADGTFKSAHALKAAYEAKGVTKDKEVIIYCQGGVRASNTYFVLKHILGYPDVRNYVGSWGQWSNTSVSAKYLVEK